MSGFMEDTFSTVSAFNLLQYVVLVETYEDNLVLHRCVVGKGRDILMLFSDSCEYYSFVCQNKW